MAILQGNYGRLLEPGLRKIFFEVLRELPEQYSQVFNVLSSKKAIETDYRMGGFGLWEKKGSSDSVQYQDPTGTIALQYIHEEFASGFTVERKLVEDEQYNTINKMSANLSRAARATIETKAAEVLNNAFNTNGYDGVPLVATNHPRLDGGTTVANKITGALTDANLKLAMILARQQVDDKGILVQMSPKILVVPPQLEYTAKTIIGSSNLSPNGNGTLQSGVSNAATDKNVIQGGLKVVVMDYLSPLDGSNNPSAAGTNYPWFLIDPSVAELNFFWRNKLEFKNTEDFDTMQAKYRGYCRFSAGYSDFRGIIASPGH